MTLHSREAQSKAGVGRIGRAQGDVPTELEHDLLAQAQADPGTVFTGSEKGYKDLFPEFRGDGFPVVANIQPDVLLPRDVNLTARFDKNLLGDVTVLKGQALYVKDTEWSQEPYDAENLYRQLSDMPPKPLTISLIPYYSWANRGISQMTVWLPVAW